MAIAYLSQSMIRNKPDLLQRLINKVGPIKQHSLGFDLFIVKFNLPDYQDNEPTLLRFYKEQRGFSRFEFRKKFVSYE